MTAITRLALISGFASLASACSPRTDPPSQEHATAAAPSRPAPFDRRLLVAFAPLPAFMGNTRPSEAQVALGRILFHDPRLSRNREISCNSCHTLAGFGVDGKPTSVGVGGQPGARNSPTVMNAAGHLAQFWDGRAADVEAQAKGPVLNPIEMAMPSDKQVVAVLSSIPGYVELFRAAFPGAAAPITWDNFAVAVGSFERMLVTPSRFDRFLAGDAAALTADEQHGLATFVSTGCTTCHAGTYLGGSMYQKAGLVKPWPNQLDRGRGTLTKNPADDMVFKVPGLRNVAETAPYFHDGSVATLPEAVKLMARHQLGRELGDADVAAIVKFLEALSGAPAPELVAMPTLPPSGRAAAKVLRN